MKKSRPVEIDDLLMLCGAEGFEPYRPPAVDKTCAKLTTSRDADVILASSKISAGQVEEDSLALAKGIVNGFFFSAVCWVVVIFVIYLIINWRIL